jgi:hypothetical protein
MPMKSRLPCGLLVALGSVLFPCTLRADEPPTPLPDEEIMRPTEYGMRMTPEIGQALARFWMKQHGQDDLDLSPEQEERIRAAAARRMMDIARSHALEGQQFWEYAIESMLSTRGKLTDDMRRGFAERFMPLLPGLHEFRQGVAEDARRILTPEQFDRLEQRLRQRDRQVERLEEQMERWSQGLAEEDERPVDILSDRPAEEDGNDGQAQARRNAQRVAENRLGQLGPPEWRRLLNAMAAFFQFDADQSAAGKKLLDDYSAQAQVVMTPEWKERVRRNRTLEFLRWQLDGQPIGPWHFRLEREYQEAIEPLNELGRSFRDEVLGLVTNEQREAALARVRERAAAHGMVLEDQDMVILGLAPPGRN